MVVLFDNLFYTYQFELYFLFSIFFLLCFFVCLGNKKYNNGYFKTVKSIPTLLIFVVCLLILVLVKKNE